MLPFNRPHAAPTETIALLPITCCSHHTLSFSLLSQVMIWNQHQGNCSLTPAQLSPPALSSRGYVVSRFGLPCEDGALAASCVQTFTENASPLGVATETSGTGNATDIRLHQVAPVLRGGWVLLGEQSKYVAVSPQRFMSRRVSSAAAAVASGACDALNEDELLHTTSGGELHLSFVVLGAAGERVDVAVIAPSSTRPVAGKAINRGHGDDNDDVAGRVAQGARVVVLEVVVAAEGRSTVECAPGRAGCRQIAPLGQRLLTSPQSEF